MNKHIEAIIFNVILLFIVFTFVFLSAFYHKEPCVGVRYPGTEVIMANVSKKEKVEKVKKEKKEKKEKIEKEGIKSVGTKRVVTAYNVGDIQQCSGDPCIAANGANVCELIEQGGKYCAANFVPFGTMLEIEGYGYFEVIDRTASKYGDRVDIAMSLKEKDEALNFGKQLLKIRIVK